MMAMPQPHTIGGLPVTHTPTTTHGYRLRCERPHDSRHRYCVRSRIPHHTHMQHQQQRTDEVHGAPEPRLWPERLAIVQQAPRVNDPLVVLHRRKQQQRLITVSQITVTSSRSGSHAHSHKTTTTSNEPSTPTGAPS
jgi:hypothetical protein